MNFQDLVKIENADKYIDLAFRKAQDAAEKTREKIFPHRFAKSKAIELDKVKAVDKSLQKHLKHILTSFPTFDHLPPFYQELTKLSLDYAKMKKSLGGVNWAWKKISSFGILYKGKLNSCQDMEFINKFRKEYLGRVSSCVKQIDPELKVLEEARKIMKGFPAVKTGVFTACICGFPNVGKSTLLAKLTPAKPEIKQYAFTTKTLNLGYIQTPTKKIQVIDTPGTLARFAKMNPIEQHAYLAVKHCADLIVYIYDLSEPYPLEQQHKLLEQLKQWNKPILIYLSKTDILDKKSVDLFRKQLEQQGQKGVICSSEELSKDLLARAITPALRDAS